VPSLDKLGGFWNDFPAGSAPYIYGVALYRFTAEKYGEDTPQFFQKNIADALIPWNADDAAKTATLQSFRGIWAEWKSEAAEKYHRQEAVIKAQGLTESERLTTSGFFKWNPIWDTSDNAIFYFDANFDEHPTIRRIELSSRKDKSVMRLHTLTEHPVFSISPDGEELVLPQATFDRSFSVYNDLWIKNLTHGRTKRLTKRLRAKDATWNPKGDRILCVATEAGNTRLVSVNPTSKEVKNRVSPRNSVSSAQMVFSKPAYSPDGNSFAVSVWQKGGYQDIWLFENERARPLIHDKAWDISPCWTPDGKYVLFASDRTGVYNIFAFQLKNRQLYQVTNVLGGAFSPSVSPDGTQIAFVGYSAGGFDIHVTYLDEAKWRIPAKNNAKNSDFVFGYAEQKATPPEKVSAKSVASQKNITSYNPFPTLLPRFWLPFPSYDESGPAMAFTTACRDVLGKHTIVTSAQYGILSKRPGFAFNYVNDQSYPSLSLSLWNYPGTIESQGVKKNNEPYYWYRTKGSSLSIHIPRITATQQVWLNLGLERQRYILQDVPANEACVPFSGELADIFVSCDFSNAHFYPKSISPTDGMRLSLAYRRYLPHLGSDATFSEVTGDLRIYLPMPLRHHVLALRGSLMRNDIGLTKLHPELDYFTIRGFHSLYAGNIRSSSAEYRFPVYDIQRGWGLLPVFLQGVHACIFTDYVRLSKQRSEYKLSAGVEVRTDAILGNLFQMTFRGGLALPIHPEHNVRPFFGIGNIF